MTEYFAHHALHAVQAVRESTRGYGPPSRDPLSRRPARASRQPRRGLRAVFSRDR
jgi:hypothetical protein